MSYQTVCKNGVNLVNVLDTELGRIIDDQELKDSLASAKPYREWIEKIRIKLDELPVAEEAATTSTVSLLDRQQAFGYTQEDIKFILEPMARMAKKPLAQWVTMQHCLCCPPN